MGGKERNVGVCCGIVLCAGGRRGSWGWERGDVEVLEGNELWK